MGGKYTNYLSNVNTYLICREQEKADSTKTNGSGVAASGASKVDKARKWGINVVNGVWLSELYLGNTYALTRTPIDERYRALDVHNHLYYDGLLVHEFMEQWKQLISLPLELIRQARMTASSPLKQANRARYTRLLSPSHSSCAFNTSRADSAKIPRMYVLDRFRALFLIHDTISIIYYNKLLLFFLKQLYFPISLLHFFICKAFSCIISEKIYTQSIFYSKHT